MYILKEEYVGTIIEIIRDEAIIIFNTNIEPESRYEYFYESGFDWCFDKI